MKWGVKHGFLQEGVLKDGKAPAHAPPGQPLPLSQLWQHGQQHARENKHVKSRFPPKDGCQIHLGWRWEALVSGSTGTLWLEEGLKQK